MWCQQLVYQSTNDAGRYVDGFFGSIIPVVLTIFGYQYLYQVFHGVFLSDMFQLQAVYPMTIQISLILIGIGMVVGLVGSFLSTTNIYVGNVRRVVV